jgi:site-specific DNA-methyltransferase (adenine-specific)
VELPERLIDLYTYRHDLVLDPFMGSGTTAVAALRTERHFVGYDTDDAYVRAARRRVDEERKQLRDQGDDDLEPLRVTLASGPAPASDNEDFQARAVREGRAARDLAKEALEQCGFRDIRPDVHFPEGVEVNFVACDQNGSTWHFDVSGGFTSTRPGLKRTDTLWKALGKAAVLHEAYPRIPLVLLTTDAPISGAGSAALGVLRGAKKPIRDVVVLRSSDDLERLRVYARGRSPRAPASCER